VIVPRAAWDTSVPQPYELPQQQIRRIVIHHDAVDYRPGQSGEEKVRALLRGVREKYGWSDLPYHYLVDRDGRVFVGRPERYAGDTHTEYDPGDALHIALLGNYSKLEPTAAQMDAVIALVVMKADQYNLTPSAIFLHGDLADTECPGANARRHFSRLDWARLLAR